MYTTMDTIYIIISYGIMSINKQLITKCTYKLVRPLMHIMLIAEQFNNSNKNNNYS